MIRLACVVAALTGFLAAPAGAQLRAVSDGAAPIVAGGRVLWAERAGPAARVLAAPAAGGAPVEFGVVPAPAGEDVWLAAAPEGVAAQVRDGRSPAAAARLYAAGPDGGGFRLLADDVGEEPFDPLWPPVSVTAAGVFTQEAVPRLRALTGGTRDVVLPPEGDPGFVAAAGGVGVASTDGALIVFDLRSGTELRQIALGRFDAQVTSLAISGAGDVAATVAVGDGSDALLWAPAGVEAVRVLASRTRMEAVATAGGRVAYVGSNRLDAGVRVTVLDGTSGATLFRGPVSAVAQRLSFDGSAVAWATEGCSLVSTVDPPSSASVLPAGGPCVRTQVAVTPEDRAGRLEVACLSAPAPRCRVEAHLTTAAGRAAGRLATSVARGRSRVLRVPVRARGTLRLTVRVTDPDGRSRVAYEG